MIKNKKKNLDEDDDELIVNHDEPQKQSEVTIIRDEDDDVVPLDIDVGDDRKFTQQLQEFDEHQNEENNNNNNKNIVIVPRTFIDPELPSDELQLYSDLRIESLPTFVEKRREILRQQKKQQKQSHNNNNNIDIETFINNNTRPLHHFVYPPPQNLSKEECWKYAMNDENIDIVCITLNSVSMNLLREVLDPREYKRSRQIFCLDVNLHFLRTLELFQAEEGIIRQKENLEKKSNSVPPPKLHVRIIAEQGSAGHEDVLHEIEEERNSVKRVSFYAKTHTPRLIYRSLQPLLTSTNLASSSSSAGFSMMANLMMMNTNTNNDQEQQQQQHPSVSTSSSSSQITTTQIQTVLVDDRELRAELPLWLHETGVLRIIPLTLVRGDYIISKDIAIERKAVSDLCQSLRSGRLNNQLSSIQTFFKHAFILVELSNGHGQPPATTTDFGLILGSGGGVGMKEMLAKLVLNLQRGGGGGGGGGGGNTNNSFPKQICILWSTGPAHSAKIILKLKNTFALSSNKIENGGTGGNDNEPDASDPSLVNDSSHSSTTSLMSNKNNNNSNDNNNKITKLQQSFSESACEVFHRLPGCGFVNIHRMINQQKKHIEEGGVGNEEEEDDDEIEIMNNGTDTNSLEEEMVMNSMVNNLVSLVAAAQKSKKKVEQLLGNNLNKHPTAKASTSAAADELMKFLNTPFVAPVVL